ncbi:MAG: heat-inducible transcriptional repressor HrcA [Candidatus Poribacteria bacterium]|nr:heat-inducible transcriptional repressor HrcA [Candidatus Poribacteria bacterium]
MPSEQQPILTDRQRHILEAIVEHYIATAEPVASKALVALYGLGVSSATVRNVMSELDAMGYLDQPHTSAGRIPSERAYRLYVDDLNSRADNSPSGDSESYADKVRKRVWDQYQDAAADEWDSLFAATCQLLSQLSDHIGVVVTDEQRDVVIDRIELVPISGRQVLAVLIMRTGIVKQRVMSLSAGVPIAQLPMLTSLMNTRLAGKRLGEIQQYVNDIRTLYEMFDGEYQMPAVEITRGTFLHEYGYDVYWDGVRNVIARSDFAESGRVGAFLETLESRRTLGELLSWHGDHERDGVRVLIGSEIPGDGFDQCSVILATYSFGGQRVGSLGVIGPMRMAYPRMIPLVQLTASVLSRYVEQNR